MRLYHVDWKVTSGWFTQPDGSGPFSMEEREYEGGSDDFVMRYEERLWSAVREGDTARHRRVFVQGNERKGNISTESTQTERGVGGEDHIAVRIIWDDDLGDLGTRHNDMTVRYGMTYLGMLVRIGAVRFYLW